MLSRLHCTAESLDTMTPFCDKRLGKPYISSPQALLPSWEIERKAAVRPFLKIVPGIQRNENGYWCYAKTSIKTKHFLMMFINKKEKFKQQKWGKWQELTGKWANQAPVPGTCQDKSSLGQPAPPTGTLSISGTCILQEKKKKSTVGHTTIILPVTESQFSSTRTKIKEHSQRKKERNVFSLCRRNRNPNI